MMDMPLRVGIGGNGKIACGVELQVKHADGMEVAWRHQPDDVESHLQNDPIDVFVEACGNVHDAAECSLLAIENHSHIVLTDPRVDVAYGLPIQTEAHQHGIVVTSDIGTPHGTLATMIQEAHIMGFDIVQAGQISPQGDPAEFLFEMAALANGFSFMPPDDGMAGPEVASLANILSAFDLDQISDTPRIDFVRLPAGQSGLYLIVRPRHQVSTGHLESLSPAKPPYYLLHRPAPLGYLETPKTILAAAAGQPVLSPGFPTCDVYATALEEIAAGALLSPTNLAGDLRPIDSNAIPLVTALESAKVISPVSKGGKLALTNTQVVGIQ